MSKYSENLARMKASGTYCDDTDPDLSFLNFRSSCKKCPNYKECKEESEKSSRAILKFRRAMERELKVKRR
jgi:hypothetical protein